MNMKKKIKILSVIFILAFLIMEFHTAYKPVKAAEKPLLESAVIGTCPINPSGTVGTDDHTAITSVIDRSDMTVKSYVRKNTELKSVRMTLKCFSPDVSAYINDVPFENGSETDLSEDVILKLTYENRSEEYLIKKPDIAVNPILPGQYADPDIDYFDGKYWIYPTTDGFSGWGGTVFHAWSSDNLIDWVDEGVILDVKDKNPGTNEAGIMIGASPWSDGNAWAPSIEEKNGKYYFYYCGNINGSNTGRCGNGKAIGVAVSDNPAGPFVANELPIVYPKMVSENGISVGQVIDPSVFTDDDGKSYLFFGNGSAAMVELNDDMMSVKQNTFKNINGLNDFRESVVVMKRNGLYHFTWSCDDTGSPNYHVNYGTASSLDGNVTYQYTLLKREDSLGILGTAHQSLVYFPDTDECYIAYHRFYTPLGIYNEGLGYHRETCIDEITFDNETGYMNKITPTMDAVSIRKKAEESKKNDMPDAPVDIDNPDKNSDSNLILQTPEENNAKKTDQNNVLDVIANGEPQIENVTQVTGKTAFIKVSGKKIIRLRRLSKKHGYVKLKANVTGFDGIIKWKIIKGKKLIRLNRKKGKTVKVTARKTGKAKILIYSGNLSTTKIIKIK